jgi:hypothetical protein
LLSVSDCCRLQAGLSTTQLLTTLSCCTLDTVFPSCSIHVVHACCQAFRWLLNPLAAVDAGTATTRDKRQADVP